MQNRVRGEAIMLGLSVIGGAFLLYAGRHLTFFFDEWDFILGRRGESVSTYLDPHNGHLSLLPVVVYKVLLALFGLRHYWPYLFVVVALHLVSVGLLYLLAQRRIGSWPAILPATLLLFMGSAYQDLLWGFQIGFVGSVASGLAALALLEDPRRRRDLLVCTLLIVSLAASSIGIPVLIAAAVMLFLDRSPWRRAWVVVLPAILYVLWYFGWGTSEQTTTQSLLAAPQYVADAASAATAGVFGLSGAYGPPLLIAGLLLLSLRLSQGRRPPTALLWAATAAGLTFWLLTAIARADISDPGASRYLYIGAVFLLLIGVDTLRGVAMTRTAWIVMSVLTLGAVVANINLLHQGEKSLRSADLSTEVSLAALRVAAPAVSPTAAPAPQTAPQITAGAYLAAVASWGSPALTLHQLSEASLSEQAQADRALEADERLADLPISAAHGDRSLTVADVQGGRISAAGACDRFSPTGPDSFVDIRVPIGSTLEVGPQPGAVVKIYVARLARQFSEPPFEQLGAPAAFHLPVDSAPAVDWQFRLVSSHPIIVCES